MDTVGKIYKLWKNRSSKEDPKEPPIVSNHCQRSVNGYRASK